MADWNPVSVHTREDLSRSATSTLGAGAYGLFELAVRYLFAEDGLGIPIESATAPFADLREGYASADVFERQFGIALGDYEVQFDERMRDSLP